MFYGIWAFRQLLSIFLPITYMYTGINRIPLQLPDKAQSGHRILTVKPKESVTKKQKIRNNAQSLLKETIRQKKRNVLSNISFTISGKISERLFNVDPWFLKTTRNFFFFFRSHSYSNSRRCLWGDHQWKIFWLLISLFSIEVYFLRLHGSPLTPPNQKYEVKNNHGKRRPRWRRIQVLSKMIIMTSMFYHGRCRSC